MALVPGLGEHRRPFPVRGLPAQMPAPLTAALSALSDRVRLIPMADDESGTRLPAEIPFMSE